MSSDNQTPSTVAPSTQLRANQPAGDYTELVMEPIGVELTTPDALRLMADVYEKLKLGVKKPEAVRLGFGAQEITIRHNTDIVVKASVKTNGTELWTISADHEIRRHFNPDFVRFGY